MQLSYDTFYWNANEVKVTSKRSIEQDKAGLPFEYTDAIECDGYITGAGQTALSAAEVAMKVAMLRQGKDLVFYQDDGNPSSVVLRNAQAVRGVRVVSGPDFSDVQGPEFVSQRHFRFTVEATYPYPLRMGTLIDWTETVTTEGGCELFVCNDAITGPAQRQKLYDIVKCVATQSGSATGYDRYPDVPAPIWPFALRRTKPRVTRTTPDKQGVSNYRRFRVEWSWEYEWPYELVGVPTLWK